MIDKNTEKFASMCDTHDFSRSFQARLQEDCRINLAIDKKRSNNLSTSIDWRNKKVYTYTITYEKAWMTKQKTIE